VSTNFYTQINRNKFSSVLLMLIFFVLIAVIGYVFALAWGDPNIMLIIGIFAIAYGLISYYLAPSIVLGVSGAKKVERIANPYIYNLVENLCITAGLPNPTIYIIPTPALNAFATGRDPRHSAVALTSGIIERLDKPELEGVIAHELSHIGNLDIRFMTLAVVLVGIVSILSNFFLRSTFWRGSDREKENDITAWLMIVGIALALLSPLIASLIRLAISRKREYLADSSAVMLTRNPDGLALALEKISQDTQPFRQANKAIAPLYIANPFRRSFLGNLFSTHPPIEERIRVLRGRSI